MPERVESAALWRTFKIYRRHLGLSALFLLLSLLANASFGLQQYYFAQALDSFQGGRLDAPVLHGWLLFLLAFACARAGLGYVGQIVGMVLGQRVLFRLRSQLYDQVLALDQHFHRQHAGGELIARTTRDSDKVRDAVVIGSRNLVDTGMLVIGGLVYLFYCDWSLGLVQSLLILAATWLLWRQSTRLVVLNRAADDAYDAVTQQFTEGVIGVRVIKAFGAEGDRFAAFVSHLGSFMQAARAALLYTAAHLPRPQLLVAVGHVWCLLVGAWMVADGDMSLGVYISILMLVTGMVFRMDGIGRVVRIYADARSSAARVWEVLDARSEVVSGQTPLPPAPLGLRFEAVRVGPLERPILQDFSLQIDAGEIVALVGRTGSGKSTLCSLCARLRDPDAGRVLLLGGDGQAIPLPELALTALRRRVQVVYQGGFLFSASVADNLRLGDPTASDAELLAALATSAASEVIAGLPQGLQALIGERGVTLSGGQRQRLCLARALVAKPDLLILDDATSALDAATEARVLAGIRATAASTGVLLIASRVSSVLLADRVVLLHEGRISAVGTHRQLQADNDIYRRLLGLDRAGAADG